MGTSKTNNFTENGRSRSSRRVAVRRRNLNVNKQGYDVEKAGVYVNVYDKKDAFSMSIGSDWVEVGNVILENKLSEKTTLDTVSFRMKFDNGVGPARNFQLKMVDQYNNYIRYINTKCLDYLEEGDIVIFQKPYTNAMGELIFQNGQDVEIQMALQKLDEAYGIWYWRCKGNNRLFNILSPDSETIYKERLKELADKAVIAKGYERKKAWQAFFKLQNRYGFIKYSFASTLHKLQGSTYESVFFDMRDLHNFYKRDQDMVLRLIYVAITRASTEVSVLQY